MWSEEVAAAPNATPAAPRICRREGRAVLLSGIVSPRHAASHSTRLRRVGKAQRAHHLHLCRHGGHGANAPLPTLRTLSESSPRMRGIQYAAASLWARWLPACASTKAGGYGSLLSQGRHRALPRSPPSYPANVGYPVRRGFSLGTWAEGFCSNQGRWLWVPAFAGTTPGASPLPTVIPRESGVSSTP